MAIFKKIKCFECTFEVDFYFILNVYFVLAKINRVISC